MLRALLASLKISAGSQSPQGKKRGFALLSAWILIGQLLGLATVLERELIRPPSAAAGVNSISANGSEGSATATGTGAFAIGVDAVAAATCMAAIAIGQFAEANGFKATAVGREMPPVGYALTLEQRPSAAKPMQLDSAPSPAGPNANASGNAATVAIGRQSQCSWINSFAGGSYAMIQSGVGRRGLSCHWGPKQCIQSPNNCDTGANATANSCYSHSQSGAGSAATRLLSRKRHGNWISSNGIWPIRQRVWHQCQCRSRKQHSHRQLCQQQ